jgi:hypothetical protein
MAIKEVSQILGLKKYVVWIVWQFMVRDLLGLVVKGIQTVHVYTQK